MNDRLQELIRLSEDGSDYEGQHKDVEKWAVVEIKQTRRRRDEYYKLWNVSLDALKEEQERVRRLENKVEELKAEVDSLEHLIAYGEDE